MSDHNCQCKNCPFDAERFYEQGSNLDGLKHEFDNVSAELMTVKSDIETFKALKYSITGAIKTLWLIAGFIALVVYDWLKAKFF